jgi:hypothetical protein
MKRSFAHRSMKTVEWVWLVIGFLSIERIYHLWDVDRSKAYMFILFAFLGFFMFVLRRKQRKAMEARWRAEQEVKD